MTNTAIAAPPIAAAATPNGPTPSRGGMGVEDTGGTVWAGFGAGEAAGAGFSSGLDVAAGLASLFGSALGGSAGFDAGEAEAAAALVA